jgi:hypothetical protein
MIGRDMPGAPLIANVRRRSRGAAKRITASMVAPSPASIAAASSASRPPEAWGHVFDRSASSSAQVAGSS